MIPLRYILAIAIACIIMSAGFTVSWHFHRSFVESFRQKLRAAAAAGELPKELEGADLDTITPEAFDLRVTEGEELRLVIADLLSYRWYIWIPIVVAFCLGSAYLCGPRGGRNEH